MRMQHAITDQTTASQISQRPREPIFSVGMGNLHTVSDSALQAARPPKQGLEVGDVEAKKDSDH